MFAHSRGHVFCSRGTPRIAENFSPQSIGTGEHLSNDGIDDGQVSLPASSLGKNSAQPSKDLRLALNATYRRHDDVRRHQEKPQATRRHIIKWDW
jgi:hypothetical protein